MINTSFGKIENNEFSYASNPLIEPSENQPGLWTNDSALYIQHGYLPIEVEEQPIKEGYYYTPTYAQVDNKIIQSWEEHKEPVDETSLYTQAMKIILGEEE